MRQEYVCIFLKSAKSIDDGNHENDKWLMAMKCKPDWGAIFNYYQSEKVTNENEAYGNAHK